MPRLVNEWIGRITEMEELFIHSTTFISTVYMPAIAWIQLWRVKSQLLFSKNAIKENKQMIKIECGRPDLTGEMGMQ